MKISPRKDAGSVLYSVAGVLYPPTLWTSQCTIYTPDRTDGQTDFIILNYRESDRQTDRYRTMFSLQWLIWVELKLTTSEF